MGLDGKVKERGETYVPAGVQSFPGVLCGGNFGFRGGGGKLRYLVNILRFLYCKKE